MITETFHPRVEYPPNISQITFFHPSLLCTGILNPKLSPRVLKITPHQAFIPFTHLYPHPHTHMNPLSPFPSLPPLSLTPLPSSFHLHIRGVDHYLLLN